MATQNLSQAVPFPQSVPAKFSQTPDAQLPKHFFGALNSGWTVVPDSLDVHWYQGRWSGKLSLISGTARLSVSFTMCAGQYRFAAPVTDVPLEVAKS
jgi:hypothetical protein